MQLSKSKKFVEEYTNFKNKISKINNEKAKAELEVLLKQLVREVNAIDVQHQELVMVAKLPGSVAESKSNLNSIRKKLLTKLEDCEKKGLLS